jgi:hypothetical protein
MGTTASNEAGYSKDPSMQYELLKMLAFGSYMGTLSLSASNFRWHAWN